MAVDSIYRDADAWMSNAFLNFIHAPLPPGLAGQFLGVLFQSHYMYFVGGVQVEQRDGRCGKGT